MFGNRFGTQAGPDRDASPKRSQGEVPQSDSVKRWSFEDRCQPLKEQRAQQ
jgi:hypothetical protein